MSESIRNMAGSTLVVLTVEQLENYSRSLIAEAKMIEQMGLENDDSLLTSEEVCKKLHVSPSTLWRWGKVGYLMPLMIGGKNLYRKSDLDNLQNARPA